MNKFRRETDDTILLWHPPVSTFVPLQNPTTHLVMFYMSIESNPPITIFITLYLSKTRIKLLLCSEGVGDVHHTLFSPLSYQKQDSLTFYSPVKDFPLLTHSLSDPTPRLKVLDSKPREWKLQRQFTVSLPVEVKEVLDRPFLCVWSRLDFQSLDPSQVIDGNRGVLWGK